MTVRRVTAGVLSWAGQTLVSLVLGVAAILGVAAVTTTPALFLSAGGGAAAVIAAAWSMVARRRRRRRLGVRAQLVRDAAAGVTLVAVAAAVLIPLHDPSVPPATPPGAGTWTLADGTHLAYGVVPATRQDSHPLPPIVILHGGPGVPDLAGELAALRPLAEQGRDVYAYAQIGAGRSTRLSDPAKNTVRRAVADLEQVRKRIGASHLVLVGHSYGAYLAAAYLVAHPQRVAKIVLSSPGDLRDGLSGTALQQRLTFGQKLRTYRLVAAPRALLAYALTQVRPASAHAFAGDTEMDARNDRVYRATEAALHCPGDPLPAIHGTGFYALQVPQSAAAPPAPYLRGRLPDVPALVIKGQCDYLPWSDATAYLDALPGSVLVYLRGAGHDAYRDRPEAYAAAVAAFLAGRRPPGMLMDPDRPPAGYQHAA